MFDSLRDKLKSFSKEAEEAAADAPAEPELEEEAADEPAREPVQETDAAPEQQATGERGPVPEPEAEPAAQPAPAEPDEPPVEDEVEEPSPSPGTAEGGKTIDPDKIEDLLWDLELSLLESDVALPVVEHIKEDLHDRLEGIRVGSREEVPGAVEDALRASMLEVLRVEEMDFDLWLIEEDKPITIMFVGVNGTGKTTAIARIAHRLKQDGYTCVLAAGDTYRAGAIEQLERHGENLGLRTIKHSTGADAAAVAYDAKEHAKSRRKDVVLLDTAGRMQTNSNLMDELKKVHRVSDPDLVVFVGDSLAGNDAIEQAEKFDEAVGIDAVILTKVDTDAKGGAALSIAQAVGKPILFLGVGQDYEDIIPYDPRWMVDRIFEPAEAAA